MRRELGPEYSMFAMRTRAAEKWRTGMVFLERTEATMAASLRVQPDCDVQVKRDTLEAS